MVISENDDVETAYLNQLRYRQWIDFDTRSMLTVDSAVPHNLDEIS